MLSYPKSLFIIDDDADDIQFLQEALHSLDASIQCHSAENGVEALEKLHAGEVPLPDYIFLDLNMPKMNGKQFLKEIKSLKKYRAVPVVIFSTSRLEKEKKETQDLGAEYFLEKPVKISELKAELKKIFAKA